MTYDIQQGYHVSPKMIHIGYLYIAVVLLATAAASKDDLMHYAGLSTILGISLFFNAKHNGFRPIAWIAAFTLFIAASYVGHWAIFKVYSYYGKQLTEGKDSRFTSANETRTRIGKLEQLKLSPYIFWRMQVNPESTPPPLIRTATYHYYSRGVWKHLPGIYDPEGIRDEEGYISDFIRSGSDTNSSIRYFINETNDEEPIISGSPDVKIFGAIDSRMRSNPIPLPHFTLGIGELGSNSSEVSLECNSLGTVRVVNPDHHVVSYSIWKGNHSTTEIDAPAEHDLQVPSTERPAILRICKQLGLKKGMSAGQILTRLKNFYNNKFSYTTHLTTPQIDSANRWTAMGIFLEQTRSGHCEYFASATTLILRECGIPARYSIGFSVNEYDIDRDEWVMRGKHAHAWCRVWSNGQWEDADLTPPSWLAMEQVDTSSWNLKLADWWQRLREDFLIWRTRDENKKRATAIIGSLIGIPLLWIIWKLSRTWQRDSRHRKTTTYISPVDAHLTEFNKLEPAISRKIGYRPHGQPLCRWALSLEDIDPDLSKLLRPLMKLHSEIRFDPEADHDQLKHQAYQLAVELKKKLKKLTPLQK